MADETLQALVLNQAGFTGWVLFGDAGEPVPSPSLLVQPWQAGMAEPEAQVWVLTGNGEGERAENALWAGDFRWLKVETDGQAQWLWEEGNSLEALQLLMNSGLTSGPVW